MLYCEQMEVFTMKMNEKIEIMLGRKRLRKTDFADSVGITYRAFANYMNGSRHPRADILNKMARELDMTPEFLTDDTQDIELTIEERFIKRVCASGNDPAEAMKFLSQSRGLFAGNSLSDDNKQALIDCLIEIFLDSRKDEGTENDKNEETVSI